MSGYRDSNAGFDPSGREHPPTRTERILAIGMIIIALAFLALTVAGAAGAPLMAGFHFAGIGIGLVEWFLGFTFVVRACGNHEGERYSPRTLRLIALIFFVLGAIVIGINLYSNLTGA